MQKRHEIFIRAITHLDEEISSVEIRCSCGEFLLDRQGSPAEVSLAEITGLVTMHYSAQYMHAQHPEKSNGSTKLIKGKK